MILAIIFVYSCNDKREYDVEANLVGAEFTLKEEYIDEHSKITHELWNLGIYKSMNLIYKIRNQTTDTLFIPIKNWSNNYKSRVDVSLNNSPYKEAFVSRILGKDTIPPRDSIMFAIRILNLNPLFSSKADSSLHVRKALAKVRTVYIPDSMELKKSKYSVPEIVFNRDAGKTSLGSYGKRVIILDIINNEEKYSVYP